MWRYAVVFSVAAAVTFALTPAVTRLSTRWGAVVKPDERRIHERPTPTLGGIAMLIAADLWLAQATSLWAAFAGIALWGAHMALTQGIFARLIADVAPPHLRATSFGAFYFIGGIGTLLASLGAGLLWDRQGPDATFLAGAGLAAVAMAILGWPDDKEQRIDGEIAVPGLLSFLIHDDPNEPVLGLKEFRPEHRPHVLIPFFSYRAMIACGVSCIGVSVLVAVKERVARYPITGPVAVSCAPVTFTAGKVVIATALPSFCDAGTACNEELPSGSAT